MKAFEPIVIKPGKEKEVIQWLKSKIEIEKDEQMKEMMKSVLFAFENNRDGITQMSVPVKIVSTPSNNGVQPTAPVAKRKSRKSNSRKSSKGRGG